jgi:rRNA maturation RNase YbeY
VSNSVTVRDRHEARRIDTRLLRKIILSLTAELRQSARFELDIYVVASPEMARLNETYLRHQGSTDVLAFDYTEPGHAGVIRAEIFLCLDEAVMQAGRFRTTWQSELIRYAIHGVLHLLGHDDHDAISRRKMKLQENRLLKQLSRQFDLAELAR